MREIAYRLHRALEKLDAAQLVYHQREYYRRGEADDEVHDAEEQRVAQRFPEYRVCRYFLEPLYADPGAVPDAEPDVVILEGEDYAVHRQIAEEYHPDEARQRERDDAALVDYPAEKRFFPGSGGELTGSCGFSHWQCILSAKWFERVDSW